MRKRKESKGKCIVPECWEIATSGDKCAACSSWFYRSKKLGHWEIERRMRKYQRLMSRVGVIGRK